MADPEGLWPVDLEEEEEEVEEDGGRGSMEEAEDTGVSDEVMRLRAKWSR